jgi:hypothetical protein
VRLEIAVAGSEHFEGRDFRHAAYVDHKLHQNFAPDRSALMAGEATGNRRRDVDLEFEV